MASKFKSIVKNDQYRKQLWLDALNALLATTPAYNRTEVTSQMLMLLPDVTVMLLMEDERLSKDFKDLVRVEITNRHEEPF